MVLKQMKYFAKVVESMSFRQAADELYISQSAVSQQISALEEELGVKLLKREGRSFSVTPAGDVFYRRAKAIMAQIDVAVYETIRIGTDDESRLRIGCLNLYEGLELRDAVLEFARTYPHVYVSVVSGNHEELYRRMVNGEFDMALNDQRRAFSDEFENFELTISDIQADIPEDFSTSETDRADVDELRELSCILVSARDGHASDEDFYRDIVGFAGSFLYAESREEARLLVAAGRGFLPMEGVGTAQEPPRGARRIRLYRGDMPLRHRFCAFWLRSHESYYMEEFAHVFKKHLDAAERAGAPEAGG